MSRCSYALEEQIIPVFSRRIQQLSAQSEEMMKLMNPLDQKRVITGGTEGIWTEKATGTGREVWGLNREPRNFQ